MEELETTEKVGFFARLFGKHRDEEYEGEEDELRLPGIPRAHTHSYTVRVRRQVVAFDEAVSAADGLKRGEQQIINLTAADPGLRERIKDFLAGVNYAQEGTFEEIGEHVYILAPRSALVETAPATPRMSASHN